MIEPSKVEPAVPSLPGYAGRVLAVVLIFVSGTAQECGNTSVNQADECTQNCGPPWSPDGDLFSTEVENNETNRIPTGFYDLDTLVFDEYTGRATGSPGLGGLVDGVNYVDVSTGYRHYLGTDGVDTDDWATIQLINLMEIVGREWEPHSQQYNLPEMMVGDASLKYGGSWMPDHSQHQNGLELDVRYMRTDHQFQHIGHLNPCLDDEEEYDALATYELLNAFLYYGSGGGSAIGQVEKIIVGRCLTFDPTDIDPRVVVDASGVHDDHFHVQIRNPGG